MLERIIGDDHPADTPRVRDYATTHPIGCQPAPETESPVRNWAAKREATFAAAWSADLLYFKGRPLTALEIKYVYQLGYESGALAEAKKTRL